MNLRRTALPFALAIVFCGAASAQDAAGPASEAAQTASAVTPDNAGDSATPGDTTHGALTIRSKPTGALVIVDGFPVGSAPVKVDSLTAGKHRLQIAMEGYFTRSATVVVRGGRDQEATFELTAPATLAVVADRAEAAVSLNGQPVGHAPHVADMLRPGKYAVSIAVEGAATYDTTLVLAAGDVDTIRAVFEPVVAQAPAAPAKQEPSRNTEVGRRIASIAAAALFGVFALVVLLFDAVND